MVNIHELRLALIDRWQAEVDEADDITPEEGLTLAYHYSQLGAGDIDDLVQHFAESDEDAKREFFNAVSLVLYEIMTRRLERQASIRN